MSESINAQDDFGEVDRLLANSSDVDSRRLRESLRGPVTASFVRRHRRRRIRRVIGMAACYLLGIGTIYAWQQVSASTPAQKPNATAEKSVETIERKENPRDRLPPRPVTPKIVQGDKPVAAAIIPIAKAPKKSQYDKLRELGDYHLLERNPEQALRCYRVALRYATDDEFTAASRQGSWLLRAICLDSKQEKNHAHEKS
jgi:hypothetical protein